MFTGGGCPARSPGQMECGCNPCQLYNTVLLVDKSCKFFQLYNTVLLVDKSCKYFQPNGIKVSLSSTTSTSKLLDICCKYFQILSNIINMLKIFSRASFRFSTFYFCCKYFPIFSNIKYRHQNRTNVESKC